jgi:hypothetical protein
MFGQPSIPRLIGTVCDQAAIGRKLPCITSAGESMSLKGLSASPAGEKGNSHITLEVEVEDRGACRP